MLISFSFVFVALTICYLSIIGKHNKRTFIILQLFLICFISWFAGFRDSLGQDYLNYVSFLNVGIESFENIYVEPLYHLLVLIVYSTSLSNVFFFLSMAAISNYFFIKYFYQFEYVFYILFIYLTSGYYFGSFNLVRQVCAAAIFLYSTKYIEKRMFFKYTFMILLAASIHLSAIFLIVFYYIGSINLSGVNYPSLAAKKRMLTAHRRPPPLAVGKLILSKYFALIILIFSFLLGWVIKINLEGLIPNIDFYYNYYLNREEIQEGSGFFIYLFNITMFFVILGKNKIPKSKINSIVFNFALIGVILYNFSGSFYFLFRFAVYFQIFIIIITTMLIYIYNKTFVKTLIILIYGFAFIFYMTNNQNNEKVVPARILPLSEIVDQ